LLDRVLSQLPPHDNRMFFFDLADPEKRSRADVANVLRVISRFQSYGHVVLGLNWREAQQVDAVLGQTPFDEATGDNLCRMATRIRNELKIGTVVVHPVDGAACATRDEAVYVRGPLCAKPKITTGAGDHFNAGFITARLIGMSPEASLAVAVATSGLYVRTAQSPSMGDIERFLDMDWNPTKTA
jgi:sugar/nucleoside kinase (ribokinase family)